MPLIKIFAPRRVATRKTPKPNIVHANPDIATLIFINRAGHFRTARILLELLEKPKFTLLIGHDRTVFRANPKFSAPAKMQGGNPVGVQSRSVTAIEDREVHPVKAGQAAKGTHPQIPVRRLRQRGH
jgi:hypothetical protein